MCKFSVTNLRPSNTINQYVPCNRDQTGNMGPCYPFDYVNHEHCALRVFTLNAHFKLYLDLKSVIRFYTVYMTIDQ